MWPSGFERKNKIFFLPHEKMVVHLQPLSEGAQVHHKIGIRNPGTGDREEVRLLLFPL